MGSHVISMTCLLRKPKIKHFVEMRLLYRYFCLQHIIKRVCSMKWLIKLITRVRFELKAREYTRFRLPTTTYLPFEPIKILFSCTASQEPFDLEVLVILSFMSHD